MQRRAQLAWSSDSAELFGKEDEKNDESNYARTRIMLVIHPYYIYLGFRSEFGSQKMMKNEFGYPYSHFRYTNSANLYSHILSTPFVEMIISWLVCFLWKLISWLVEEAVSRGEKIFQKYICCKLSVRGLILPCDVGWTFYYCSMNLCLCMTVCLANLHLKLCIFLLAFLYYFWSSTYFSSSSFSFLMLYLKGSANQYARSKRNICSPKCATRH